MIQTLAFESVEVAPEVHVEAPIEEPVVHTAPVDDSYVSHTTTKEDTNTYHPVYTYPYWLFDRSNNTSTISASCTPSICNISPWVSFTILLVFLVIIIGGVTLFVRSATDY